MKKSLLALAVLGAFASAASAQSSTPSSAQSSVTLSGMLDAGVRRVGAGNGSDWQLGGSQSGYNNFTLSGREALGGGMTAFFSMNHRFSINNGTVNSQQNICGVVVAPSLSPALAPAPSVVPTTICPAVPTFWRNIWVGLGGGFGDVRLGRILMPLQDMNGGFDPFNTGTVGSVHTGGITATIRANNAIYYRSPSMGGLSLHAAIAAGEGQLQGETANNFGSSAPRPSPAGTGERPVGANLRYAAGPLTVGVAYDRNYAEYKTVGAYASYDFGAFKLMGQYETGDSNNSAGTLLEDLDNMSIGVTVPFGPVLMRAGYIRIDSDRVNRDASKFGFGGDYSLSKRTNLYATVGKSSGNRLTVAQKKAAFDLGVTHRF